MACEPSKGAAPKERADVLLRTRHSKMARNAHAYVRGSTAKFSSGMRSEDATCRAGHPFGSAATAIWGIWDPLQMRKATLTFRFAISIRP